MVVNFSYYIDQIAEALRCSVYTEHRTPNTEHLADWYLWSVKPFSWTLLRSGGVNAQQTRQLGGQEHEHLPKEATRVQNPAPRVADEARFPVRGILSVQEPKA
jgi:hypothetical protein